MLVAVLNASKGTHLKYAKSSIEYNAKYTVKNDHYQVNNLTDDPNAQGRKVDK